MKVKGKLPRKHEIFNGSEKNARTLVITSLITLRHRHGPSALKLYRTSKLGFTTRQAQDIMAINDPEWLYNLEGLFVSLCFQRSMLVANNSNRYT